MKELTSVQAKTHFGAVLEAVEGGEEFVITRNGKRVARLAPVSTGKMSRAEAFEKLRTFAQDRGMRLGDLDWRKLRDQGRR